VGIDAVRRIALALPEAYEQASYDDRPSWRTKPRMFAVVGEDRGKLAVWVASLDEKDALLASDPAVFSTTPHHDGHPIVLIDHAAARPGLRGEQCPASGARRTDLRPETRLNWCRERGTPRDPMNVVHELAGEGRRDTSSGIRCRPMDVAELLREARADAGLTQRELARRARTSQAAIARYETGVATPSIATLRRLLAAAGRELVISAEPRRAPFTGPVGRLVEARRPQLERVLVQHGARRPRVFGSVARGDDHERSDLDLLVDVDPADYVGLEELRLAVEDALGLPVDLAIESLLRDDVRERSLAEAVPL
jgi:uncharacterized protein